MSDRNISADQQSPPSTAAMKQNAGADIPCAETAPDSAAAGASSPTNDSAAEGEQTLAEQRHDSQAIAHAFESGEYPHKSRIRRASDEKQKEQLQVEPAQSPALGEGNQSESCHLVRRPRRSRQGRHHQTLHGTPQPSQCASRGARQTQRG